MEEEKLRAYLKDEKRIVDVISLDLLNGAITYYDDGAKEDLMVDKEDYTLIKYTGLKDSEEKEIYMGDIIAIEGYVNHIVGFECGMFVWANIRPYIPIYKKLEQCRCVVIGSVYMIGARTKKGERNG